MTSVAALSKSAGDVPVIVCDVSPPRGARMELFSELRDLEADFLSVAYNPGQSVRVNPAIYAAHIQNELGKAVIFTLATRDMNRIAIQSLLLGASTLGLENVVVLRGDPIRSAERKKIRSVNDYVTTELIKDIHRMNRGVDFRGLPLMSRTSFCVGAVADPSRDDIDREARLARNKLRAGSEFILGQAQFDATTAETFRRRIGVGADPEPPLFQGVQIFERGGVNFGNVPERVVREVESGRDGLRIAKSCARRLWDYGARRFYVTPSIMKGGTRDYRRADELMCYIRSMRAA